MEKADDSRLTRNLRRLSTGVLIAGMLGTGIIIFKGREVPRETAEDLCKQYCGGQNVESELRSTGEKVGALDRVECWCKTSQGWRRNRTNLSLAE